MLKAIGHFILINTLTAYILAYRVARSFFFWLLPFAAQKMINNKENFPILNLSEELILLTLRSTSISGEDLAALSMSSSTLNRLGKLDP